TGNLKLTANSRMAVDGETLHHTVPTGLRWGEGINGFIPHHEAGTCVATKRQCLIGGRNPATALAQTCGISVRRRHSSAGKLVSDQVSAIQVNILHSYGRGSLTSFEHE